MRSWTTGQVVAVALAVVVLVAACSSGGAPSTSRAAPSTSRTTSSPGPTSTPPDVAPPAWHRCSDGECAAIPAPLDPAHPDGAQIHLALYRHRAPDPARRVGALLTNPGGPGAPGIDFAHTFLRLAPAELKARFDVVGWDPRGTGQSTAVDCGSDLDYLFAADTAPSTPAQLEALEAVNRQLAQTCAARSKDLLAHIASRDTVADMDRIRAALGEAKLTYVGFSYGTYLGALYAQAHPDRVRALVLDGAVDPSLSVEQVAIQQAVGFDQSFTGFLGRCAASAACSFRNGGNPHAAYLALQARVDRSPEHARLAGEDRTLGPTQLDIAVSAALYSGAAADQVLAGALRDAQEGDPAGLLTLFDEYVGRHRGGRYDTQWPAFVAISCLDGPDLDLAATIRLQQQAAAAAPIFGASNVGLTGYACAQWPLPPVTTAPTPVHAPSSPPIVVVGTTGDPATPVAWAQSLAGQLGSARLVTVTGTSHTSFLEGNTCLDTAVDRYLLTLAPPDPDLHCPA